MTTHDLPLHLDRDLKAVQVVLHQDHLDGICALIHFCEGVSSSGKSRPPGMQELIMHYRNIRSALYQTHETEIQKYHEVMVLLRNLAMPHGKCKPREDKACTACNAQDALDLMLAQYKGLTLQPTLGVTEGGQTHT